MTTHDARIEALLKALQPGQRLWLRAGGRSLWPLVIDGDLVQVERGAALARGDIALVLAPSGALVAHLVRRAEPVVTESSGGIVDPEPREVFGRVVALRRRGLTFPIPRTMRLWLLQVPLAARVVRRIPGLRTVARLARLLLER